MARKRMVQAINEGIAEEMARDPSIIVMGEDVHISPVGDTRNLIDRFGPERILTTPISETVMTGMAVGAAASSERQRASGSRARRASTSSSLRYDFERNVFSASTWPRSR